MHNAVFCIIKTQSQAAQIVDQLRGLGFRNDDISVLFPDTRRSRDFAYENHTRAPESAEPVVGGTLGLLAGIGALGIPGLGPFIAAGPIRESLRGAAAGAGVGGITSVLVGLGMPETAATRCEAKVRSGNLLISVHADDNTWADRARGVFSRFYGEDIATGAEAAAPREGGASPSAARYTGARR